MSIGMRTRATVMAIRGGQLGGWMCLALLLAAPAWVCAATPQSPHELQVEQVEVALEEFDAAQNLLSTNPDRARQLFRSAAQRYEAIIASGVRNGPIEYNLGNAYLQAGDIGRAILHYRRAERLIPGDPLLADNLRVARSRRVTEIKASDRSVLLRSVFFLHYGTTTDARAKLALVAYVLGWVLLGVRLLVRRRWLSVWAVVSLAVAGSLLVSVQVDRWKDRHAPEGVIVSHDVTVYKGPGEGYQRQFVQPLQPGVEFTLRERRGGWSFIELPDGQSGWIEGTKMMLVSGEGA